MYSHAMDSDTPRIIKQNEGPLSWATGGSSGGDDDLTSDGLGDNMGRRNGCELPSDVPTLGDLKGSR